MKLLPLKYLHLHLKLLFPFLSLALSISAQGVGVSRDSLVYNIIHLEMDTLPSLNISRAGHTALCLDGQLTVFGGHTDGFTPTQTAEYFKDGAWHTVPLVYPQDHSIIIPLRSGKVFLAGGHHESLGIGHRFSAEIYDPSTNTSQGFGCLDQKRAFANAAELADGQIVVSGNWHEKDAIEMFENIYNLKRPNAIKVKDVSYGRVKPYILRISNDDAIIFSSLSNDNELVDSIIIDCVKGESYQDPFFDTWIPLESIATLRSLNQFIGDESQGRYQWLIPVFNPQAQQIAIAKVEGITKDNPKPTFSLLPLSQPFPLTLDGKQVIYSSLICDRERQMAYLIGDNEDANVFVFAFPYNGVEPAPLTIYQTAPQPFRSHVFTPMATPEGDLVFAGGFLDNNFITSKAVLRLPLGSLNSSDQAVSVGTNTANNQSLRWIWIVFLCLLAIGDVFWYYTKRHNKTQNLDRKSVVSTQEESDSTLYNPHSSENNAQDEDLETEPEPENDETQTYNSTEDKAEPGEEVLINLFKRIEQLMEQEQLYLNPNLKTSDVAIRLTSNVKYVSTAINSQGGCSFTQFITNYRISYAQKLMLEVPDSKLTMISSLSGFTTESTFFRAFRSVTGMSPKEWLATKSGEAETQ